MKKMLSLEVEPLEPRNLPSATVLGGTLFVRVENNHGTHVNARTVSIDLVVNQIQVNEDGVLSIFDPATVTSLYVKGAANIPNVVQNNTSLPSTLLGGNRADTLFGGTGTNTLDPGKGNDTVYALLGMNTINVAREGTDQVFTNYAASVNVDAGDLVARFFGPGRTPGTPFIGFDSTLNDGVLYVTPTNNGSSVTLLPAGKHRGDVLAIYDLGDGSGLRSQVFAGVKAIAYFGGTGNDSYRNETRIREAAYGSAGNDTLVGGLGASSVLKGSGGNDVITGRARHVDLSGNGGADMLAVLTPGGMDVFRVDVLDTVFGVERKDVVITP